MLLKYQSHVSWNSKTGVKENYSEGLKRRAHWRAHTAQIRTGFFGALPTSTARFLPTLGENAHGLGKVPDTISYRKTTWQPENYKTILQSSYLADQRSIMHKASSHVGPKRNIAKHAGIASRTFLLNMHKASSHVGPKRNMPNMPALLPLNISQTCRNRPASLPQSIY